MSFLTIFGIQLLLCVQNNISLVCSKYPNISIDTEPSLDSYILIVRIFVRNWSASYNS